MLYVVLTILYNSFISPDSRPYRRHFLAMSKTPLLLGLLQVVTAGFVEADAGIETLAQPTITPAPRVPADLLKKRDEYSSSNFIGYFSSNGAYECTSVFCSTLSFYVTPATFS